MLSLSLSVCNCSACGGRRSLLFLSISNKTIFFEVSLYETSCFNLSLMQEHAWFYMYAYILWTFSVFKNLFVNQLFVMGTYFEQIDEQQILISFQTRNSQKKNHKITETSGAQSFFITIKYKTPLNWITKKKKHSKITQI